MDEWTDGRMDRQTDRQTGRQTDRQTDIEDGGWTVLVPILLQK